MIYIRIGNKYSINLNMPKVSSLKKVCKIFLTTYTFSHKLSNLSDPPKINYFQLQQAAPPKNQKAITQFFKNTNTFTNRKPQKSPDKSQTSQVKCSEQKSAKRKAVSPVNLGRIEILDESSVSNGLNNNLNCQNGLHTPKKIKTDNLSNKSPAKHRIVSKNSPQKENEIMLRSSPQQNHEDYLEILLKEEGNAYEDDADFIEIKRSPLIPVKNENYETNKINSLISNDNIIQSCAIQIGIGNREQKQTVKTPKKVLQFESNTETNTQIFVRNRTPKKSPNNGKFIIKLHVDWYTSYCMMINQ